MAFKNSVIIQLGSNEGNALKNLENAASQIQNLGSDFIFGFVYKSDAWGLTNQPSFFNQIIQFNTTLNPFSLLKKTQAIELALGRKRKEKWGPRVIDIDILFFGSKIIYTPELTVPHPYIHERLFVLKPLAETHAKYLHPLLNKTILDLLNTCKDTLNVHRI